MKTSPFVSVIILNFNGKNYLEECLDSVLRTEYPNFEVILVDNASTDRSLNLAEQAFGNDKRLKIIRNSRNLGYSGGNNIGFDQSMGTFIVFLNNDTIVDRNWLTSLVNAMMEDETIGLAQSMILKIDGTQIQTAGSLLSDYLILQQVLLEDKPSTTNVLSVFETSYACGASMIIRRELVDRIGLFDPRIPFYYDDTLLSLKTWLAGKRVVVISKSRVRHAKGVNLVWKTYFTAFNFSRAYMCLIFDAYYNLAALSKALLMFGAVFLLHSIFAIRSRNLEVFTANIYALNWVFLNLKCIWINRLEHWSKAKIAPAKLLEKFIRIKLPASTYLLPSRIASIYYKKKLRNYETSITGFSSPKKTFSPRHYSRQMYSAHGCS